MVKYYIEDARKTLQHFIEHKSKRPNCIITSPPYFDLKNYENSKSQIGYKQTYEEYLHDVVDVLNQCYDISTENSTLWVIVDTFKRNGELITLPTDINYKIKESRHDNKWILRDIIIWYKDKNLPWYQKGRFKNEFEYILFFTKNKDFKFNIDEVREIIDYKKWWKSYPERYNPFGKAPSNFWDFTTPIRGWGNGKQNHLCPFPFSLIERIILLSTNEKDLVFDPFAGSGSVLSIAKVLKRSALGFDINERYKEIFESEVLNGAAYYWEKRERELTNIKSRINEFSSLNSKLRLIKSSKKIISCLKYVPKGTKFMLFFTEEDLANVKLYFITPQKIDLSSIIDVNLIKLVFREFGVNFSLENIIQDKLKKMYSDQKFYSYIDKKIYAFDNEFDINFLYNEPSNDETLYSNIKLNIK